MVRRRGLCVSMVSAVMVLAGAAAAAPKVIESPNAVSGQGKSFDRDTGHFGPTLAKRCAKGDTGMASSLKSWAASAAELKDPTDRQAFSAYMAAVQKAYDAQQVGIPGHGTYAELTARRAKELAEVEAAFPTITAPTTAAEMATIRDGYKAYRARAGAAFALAEKLRDASPCLDEAGDWNPIWHGLKPEFVEGRIDAHATPIGNQMMSGFSRYVGDVEPMLAASTTRPADADAMAKLVHLALAYYQTAVELEPTIALAPAWAEFFVERDREKVKGAPAKIAALKASMLALVTQYLPEVKPPAGKPDAASDKAFRTWHTRDRKGTKLLGVRVATSGKNSAVTTERGVTYKKAWKFASAYFVTPLLKPHPEVPGFKTSDLCELHWVMLLYYEQGKFETLKRWHPNTNESVRMSTMLCKNATAKF